MEMVVLCFVGPWLGDRPDDGTSKHSEALVNQSSTGLTFKQKHPFAQAHSRL